MTYPFIPSEESIEQEKDTDSNMPVAKYREKPKRPLGYYEYQFYKSFGGFGLGNGYFQEPVDIDIDKNGDVYVCDKKGGRIQRFDDEGNFQDEWEGIDLDTILQVRNIGVPERMNNPEGICVDYRETLGEIIVYVADTKNNRILLFNRDGKLLDPEGKRIKDYSAYDLKDDRFLGKYGLKKAEFHFPLDIVVDHRDNFYVLDSLNKRIKCFDDKGEPKSEWGGFGSRYGNFLKPVRLAYDPSRFGTIWVIDAGDGKIKQYELDGDFLRSLIPADSDGNPLPNPTGIYIGNYGFIYLTDSKLNKIFKYNNDLEYIQSWGEEGAGEGQFQGIGAIAVNKEDKIFVIDQGNYRVHIFRRL